MQGFDFEAYGVDLFDSLNVMRRKYATLGFAGNTEIERVCSHVRTLVVKLSRHAIWPCVGN